MYVTRPFSLYKNSPESLSSEPPEGPNSGYLVIHDEELTPTCFGLSNDHSIKELPLPSNKILKLHHGTYEDEILAVPVINQALSSNRYYVIKASKKHKGEAYVCSKGEKPRRLAPEDMYQQFEFSQAISCRNNIGFSAKSILPDAYVPRSVRTISKIQTDQRSPNCFIEEAKGVDNALRSRLPDFDFPLSRPFPGAVCVGKWYCPFMFIHDGKVEEQVKKSVYYEMTLEQRWDRVFATESRDNRQGQGMVSKVMMDVVVPTQVVAIGGKDGVVDERHSDNKVVWYKTIGSVGEEMSVGLSSVIVERMMWEQNRVGWVHYGNEKQVRVVREEEYGGIGWWVKFGCFVLVETFVLRRFDGTLLFTIDFKQTHQIRTKWE